MKENKKMNEEYEVGYGKPPKKNQFKKGQSGNPNGRPRKSRSRSTLMEEELNLQITVKEGNQTIMMRKSEAVIKQLVNKAIKGDARAAKIVLEHLEEVEPESKVAQAISNNDREILNGFLKTQSDQNDD